MKNKHFVHNGDVQAISVASLPETAKQIDHKPIAYGEVSGHIHIATGDVVLMEDEHGNMFACVGDGGAMLQHVHESTFNNDYSTRESIGKADHNPATLKPNGIYKLGIHRRYNPLKAFWEKVKD